MPSRLGELTKLQTLSLFVIGGRFLKGMGKVSELKCLNNLRGKLQIKNLEEVKGGAFESKEANLKEKHYLQSLVLEWYVWGPWFINEDGESVMEGLQPHSNLKELYIAGYPSVRFPSWFGTSVPW